MQEYKKVVHDFITGTHLIQFKGYYELDIVNQFANIRYVFHIPRELFDMMIFTKEKMKIQAKQIEKPKPREIPVFTS